MAEKNVVEKIADTKVGELSLLDGVFIGASKVATEEILLRVPGVGNQSYRSAIIKGIGAIGLAYLPYINKYKVTKIVETGLVVDATEDLIVSLKRTFLGGASEDGFVVVN
jgi:hypothetical protein